jgi:2-oxo-hept-3-ene-1,7-dioate hydratase
MTRLFGFCLAIFACCTANAHHATSANFTQEIISVDGIVEQVRFQNPHTSLLISQTSDDGKKSYWLLETVGRTTLERRGVPRDRLVVGEKIHATGQNGRRQNTMYLHEVEYEDGRKINFFSVARPVSVEQIRAELVQMADDFMNFREMKGFHHEMTLADAFRWQDEMVEIMAPAMGDIAGYKTGGHDPGPGFPTFPPEGIRAYILEGMLRPSGTAVRVEQFRRGFLEADFAFRVGDNSINDAETDLEILAGLDAIIPFAEIPDPYYEPDTRTINGTIVANMGTRMSFTGEPVQLEATEEWLEKINNFTFAVYDENDVEIQSGQMNGWYEPITVVRWIRDQIAESGKELKPGQLLSLGNIGIIRQLHEGSPRGPAYTSNQFRLEYHGLTDEPAIVIINVDR